jgi:small subunit ribosomal protein S18
MGFFRAQPLEIGVRKKKKPDPFMEDEELKVDYKDGKLLCRFMSERGRILPRRMTGLNSHNQRLVAKAIKRARNVGILPYVAR